MEGWKMIKLKDGGLQSILPPNLNEQIDIQCFCDAVDIQIRKLLKAADGIAIFSDVRWNDSLCNYLGAELRTPFFSEKLGLETKRELIQKSLLWYGKLGTVSAVQEIIENVFGYAEIQESEDEAYSFSVRTTDATLTGEKASDFAKQIETIKNVRSQFKGIEMLVTDDMNTFVGFMLQVRSKEELFMVYYERRVFDCQLDKYI